ncbi:MAG: Bud site selection protein bud4 [Pycnora praestabilis]|nr:MAG: Bud site selection protein bud4 [Pycnora praestabilis]
MPEPRDSSPSPAKRSSIENLKKASRVKNSNMFARECKKDYDQASTPFNERPLGLCRPLSVQMQGNAYGGRVVDGFRKDLSASAPRNGSRVSVSDISATLGKMELDSSTTTFLSKSQGSPTKSSLSKAGRFTANPRTFDPENGTWSEEEDGSSAERQLPPGRALHRHAKSVTFDAAPPQINEYEMTTPDLSSVASGSREGSYESTVDDDENEDSFNRGSSLERDESFDASLEDIDKTPVVGPEDWSHMSPRVANGGLAGNVEDPFNGDGCSPSPTALPSTTNGLRPSPSRNDSVTSNGEHRPLPPLPPTGVQPLCTHDNRPANGGSALAGHIGGGQRTMGSSPGPASFSKEEIKGIGGIQMSLEDRLRLMMIQDEDSGLEPIKAQPEAEMRLANSSQRSPELNEEKGGLGINIHENEEEDDDDDVASLGDYALPPQISRESILRKVKGRSQHLDEINDHYSSPAPSLSPEREHNMLLDPDVPLPSLEEASTLDDGPGVTIKPEEDDDESEVDVYSIPELYSLQQRVESRLEEYESGSVIYHDDQEDQVQETDNYSESRYSPQSSNGEQPEAQSTSVTEDEGPPTPKQQATSSTEQFKLQDTKRMSLPKFASLLGTDDFEFGLRSYMTSSPPLLQDAPMLQPTSQAHHHDLEVYIRSLTPEKQQQLNLPETSFYEDAVEESISRPLTPVEQLQPPRFPGHGMVNEDPQTPESVIRHPIAHDSPPAESPSVPEPVATIKAPGGKLKTRPSTTPADMLAMANARRQVSGEEPPVPPIPERHQNRLSTSGEGSSSSDTSKGGNELEGVMDEHISESRSSRRASLVQLDVPVKGLSDGLGLGLTQEFDRVIEGQKVEFIPSPTSNLPHKFLQYTPLVKGRDLKFPRENFANDLSYLQRGYLMRQNTKVIVASSNPNIAPQQVHDSQDSIAKGSRPPSSPRKASQDRTQTWTTEPWNGKMRRKSIRQTSGSPHKKSMDAPAPPLPGKESNVTAGLGSVAEDEATPSFDEIDDGSERGRLFVKVIGIKDLHMPLPKSEQTWFSLTLDNGLHCVTTAYLELGKNAPIGQEFELVVLNDLEFQLTLQTKIEPPAAPPVPETPTKKAKIEKPSTFSRVFASPKKRKELEKKQQEEDQRAAAEKQADAQMKRRTIQPTAWDLLHNLVAPDGSFARSYFCLKDHENRAYGRPFNVDIPCFNEWATEDVAVTSSVKSKRSTTGACPQRKPPYRIGKLELQLLFVPKPKGAKDSDMPKSMNACLRELKEAEASARRTWEGHLSQQGGDCPYWRRRFFKLDGSKLTAYHEATLQPRATINLAKASKLIDDRSALTKKEVSGKGGSRRKSAFAEEEEGYMFVEEGFRVRFSNGETIDFYADSAAEKNAWMKVLEEVVGKETHKKGWTDMVFAREKANAAKGGQTKKPFTPGGMKSASGSPNKNAPPPPVEKSPRHHASPRQDGSPVKTNSMLF